jgi:phosphohistidine swiveling domain-containing protein
MASQTIDNNHKSKIMDTYKFHHSLDFLILRATEKILKTKSLEVPKQHFYNDFSNDTGIINLLRQTYLKNGDINETFEIYQNSRLEPKSYRYESLLALLIITIVGNIISGILLETYISHKSKLKKIFDDKIISSAKVIPEKLKERFLSGKNDLIRKDFEKILNCYFARQMLDRQIIDTESYYSYVNHFLYNNKIQESLELLFDAFIESYSKETNSINIDKIMDIIEGYSRGTYLKYLDELDCEIIYFEDTKSANLIEGNPASPGYVKGKILKVQDLNDIINFIRDPEKKKILCFGGYWSPEYLKIVYQIDGVITWNTGMTGHLPLISRSLSIPCVIISPNDADKLIPNDDIILSAGQGLIYTGLFVEQ